MSFGPSLDSDGGKPCVLCGEPMLLGSETEKTVCKLNPYDPWDWYIHLHLKLMFMVNVGEYTAPMDILGKGIFM